MKWVRIDCASIATLSQLPSAAHSLNAQKRLGAVAYHSLPNPAMDHDRACRPALRSCYPWEGDPSLDLETALRQTVEDPTEAVAALHAVLRQPGRVRDLFRSWSAARFRAEDGALLVARPMNRLSAGLPAWIWRLLLRTPLVQHQIRYVAEASTGSLHTYARLAALGGRAIWRRIS